MYSYDILGNISGYNYNIGSSVRGVIFMYNQNTGEYDYTEYEVGSTTVTKNFDYETDSLRRLDNIELSIGAITFTQSFYYDDNSVVASMGNATNRISSITYNNNGTETYHTYQYDQSHNITQVTVYDDDTYDIIDQYNYHYDGFNQLTREDISINYGSYERTFVYQYDNFGNIVVMTEHNYTIASSVYTPIISEKEFYYDSLWKEQLILVEERQGGNQTMEMEIEYDSSGNPDWSFDFATGEGYEIVWDGRLLTQFEDYNAGSINFKYNDQGIRVQKGDHTYVVDGSKVLVEKRGTSVIIYYTYDVDGSLLSMNYNGNEYFFITNLLGDVIELIDINGNSVAKYKYDSWGNIIYQTGSMADENPYRYRGYRYDSETGWYYLESRYYNPKIGRFISADGILGEITNIQSHNLYSYAYNNPTMNVDQNGRFPISILDLIGYSTPTLWQLFDPISNEAYRLDGEKGNGGSARFLYFDFYGPTVSLNQATLIDAQVGMITFYQDYDGIDFGFDLFTAQTQLGFGTELIGFDIGASAFTFPFQFEMQLDSHYNLIIGFKLELFAYSKCFKVEKWKLEFGGATMFGGKIIIGIEEE
jgi:RHS repeat-associated protein